LIERGQWRSWGVIKHNDRQRQLLDPVAATKCFGEAADRKVLQT